MSDVASPEQKELGDNKPKPETDSILETKVTRRQFLKGMGVAALGLAASRVPDVFPHLPQKNQQESKESVPYSPSITIVDAAPSAPTEGIIQKEFVSNERMLKNVLGNRYISKEQLIEKFGQDYEEKWDEILANDRYRYAFVHRFSDTYFTHGKKVADVVAKNLERSGVENTGINMLPLQRIFDKSSVEFIKDSSGNPGISVNFDQRRIIWLLKDDPNRVVNFSFQVGEVEFFVRRQPSLSGDKQSTDIVMSDEQGNYKVIPTYGIEPISLTADESVIKTGEDFLRKPLTRKDMERGEAGNTLIFYDDHGEILGYVDGASGERVLAKDIPDLTEEDLRRRQYSWRQALPPYIVGAYDQEKAKENLPKLFEVAKAYPDKLFVVAGGNSGEDIREAMEKLSDERPSNLIIVAEWDGKVGKPRHDMYGADIYVDNISLGLHDGSSFSTPLISAEVYKLINQGISMDNVREKILASSDTHTFDLVDGTKPTVRVFNPTNLK